MVNDEKLEDYLLKIEEIVNAIRGLGENIDDIDVVKKVLRSFPNKFDSKMRNFLWNDWDRDKLALIKWENICKPKALGGLGDKNLQWKKENFFNK